ncbi:30S ribosomal protein S8 [bacterium]|nr:30S ribosomal protein S8 [bacterium]
MLDPISDMLTRIRNAQMSGHNEVVIPASKLKWAVAKILENKKFVESAIKKKADKFDVIKIVLKYKNISNTQKMPAISGIKRVSRQGQRIYLKKDKIRKVKNGFGIAIISTSKGLLTGEEAYQKKIGGEYICEVW